MLAGLKAVQQQRRMRTTKSRWSNCNNNEDTILGSIRVNSSSIIMIIVMMMMMTYCVLRMNHQ